MKHILFVWIPLVLLAMSLVAMAMMTFPVPIAGAIMLAGSSVTLYATGKSFGVYQVAKTLPTGEGVEKSTKDRLMAVLIAVYVIIVEALIIQYIRPDLQIPLNEIFNMAAAVSGACLGGGQAIKSAEIQGK
jgi:hypothetical protein